MGTPAFPNLGKHCSVEDCNLIDFLPFTCDSCHKVFCLDHRSYIQHQCPKENKNNITVDICPICAKAVRLIPAEDPNTTWDSHLNTDCDPSNYEKVTKKKKCPIQGCREILTFSNRIKCRDCTIEHCLKHRFGLDHSCPMPKKLGKVVQLKGYSNRSEKEEPKPGKPSSFTWSSGWLDAISSILSGELSSDSGGNNQVEHCPLCRARFPSGMALVDHVQKVHKQKGVMKVKIDGCPKCSKGFSDTVALVEHVQRHHGGTSKA